MGSHEISKDKASKEWQLDARGRARLVKLFNKHDNVKLAVMYNIVK